ncbi:mitochondrial ribosomal protein S9 isoform X1 [Megachile rotundata]|uniref:mitochondrial ribosomal protein S9 isoform X1 n=2 Tax=Megachile rotundata TaxID=143995 RepID=UPI003FD49236
MNENKNSRREKSQHVQVFVRVRPTNAVEKNNKSKTIVEVANDRELIVEYPHDKVSKKYKFDNVFGPSARQIDIYNVVVNPLLEQVLAGYNCTVFAYGQTGTGKTFTMEGNNSDPTLHWQNDSSAGIIPRSLSHLFDTLRVLEIKEYRIRVSFLELYNENLFDLLSTNDDCSKIKLYEDASKKGAITIHGLEEVRVRNKSEVYKILEKGSERRKTAATLLNSQSSRSHTVFSITVHMKENTIDGEEVLKTGKLNLVDLAGSENIGRSGAIEKRAREAGSINQSLLTLGRVITALVERAPHVPYRESKLTRLLQESLGGRTKTSIIATISPAAINLEETLSTLDYAHRARNITNRPEINQKLSKKEFLKQYRVEIERLRKDLEATREENGVCLANENYQEMQTMIAQLNKDIKEKINHIKALEKTVQDKEKIYNDLEVQTLAQTQEFYKIKNKLDNVTSALKSTDEGLKMTIEERDTQKFLLEKYVNTEQSLLNQAQNLLNIADTATSDLYKLHDKIERQTQTEQTFKALSEQFRNNVSYCVQGMEKDVIACVKRLINCFTSIKNDIDLYANNTCESVNTAIQQIAMDLIKQHLSNIDNLKKSINEFYSNDQKCIKDKSTVIPVSTVECKHELLNKISITLVNDIQNIMRNEIVKNLQIIRNNVTQKLKRTSILMKEMIDSACYVQLEAYNDINKNIQIIANDVEMLDKRQQFTEKQKLFAKMMQDAVSQFNRLYKSQEEHYSSVTDKCNYVSKICNDITDYSTKSIALQNDLKDQIQRNLQKIETNVILKTEESEELADKTANQGKILINALELNINKSCNILKQYKNLTKNSIKEVQQKFDVDRNKALLLVNNAQEIITNVSKDAGLMKGQQIKITEISNKIIGKLEDQSAESSAWSDRIPNQLKSIVGDVNKFFDEDLQRDVPTGTTPARREFSYPRQFIATSPHEQILQRFRQARKPIETSEDDSILSKPYSTVNDEIVINSDNKPSKKIHKAMQVYFQQAEEYKEFIQKQIAEYDIGKRHLANMMGEDPENFSEADINRSIKYLFPSGLYEPEARPMIIHPSKLYASRKEAEFDESGRPHHFLYYTTKPNYYNILHKIAENMIKLNELEDKTAQIKKYSTIEDKFDVAKTEWLNKTELEEKLLEELSDAQYEYFLTSIERVLEHPFSNHASSLLNECRKQITAISTTMKLPLVQFDENNRPYILLKNCARKCARGDVKVIGNGTGNITINGEDISYFTDIQCREQVIFPLIFSDMSDKVDVEVTVSGGGPTGQAGLIRWGIAKALRNFVSKEMIEKMRIAGLLTHDMRRRERKKFGQEGARRKFTWKKR